MFTKTCPVCGKCFFSPRREAKYCRRKCYELDEKRSEIRLCLVCGKEIYRKKSEFNVYPVVLCDVKCRGVYKHRLHYVAQTITCPNCEKKRRVTRNALGQRKTHLCKQCSQINHRVYPNKRLLEVARKWGLKAKEVKEYGLLPIVELKKIHLDLKKELRK